MFLLVWDRDHMNPDEQYTATIIAGSIIGVLTVLVLIIFIIAARPLYKKSFPNITVG